MSGSLEVKVIRRRSEASLQKEASSANAVTCPEREKGRELLYNVVCGLVDYPESIAVTYVVGERTTIYKVDCSQKCLGQIIGAKGKNISGVRAVIAATMARKGIRAIIEIPYFLVEA